ncbi:MAG: DUF1707 domain-containing protein [Streptosporangiaceae bacterium]
MTDRSIRASDKERESVVDVLRDAYTEGRLTLDEFEERTTAAYASKTWDNLRELTGDLPVEPVLGADLPQRRPQGQVPVQHVLQAPARTRSSGRERPLGRLLPVVFIWIMIAAAAGSPDTAAALSVVFICLLACRVGYGGRG